ncbi:MAG TPA: hypothetical protein VFZ97_08750 [Acidimicrobiales bacterium]
MSSSEIDTATRFRHLEGYRVAVVLADGSQLDDVELISAGRGEVDSLWLDREGADLFVRKVEVVELHEVAPHAA